MYFPVADYCTKKVTVIIQCYHFLNDYKILDLKSQNILRPYTVPSATSSTHQEHIINTPGTHQEHIINTPGTHQEQVRDRVDSPDNVVSSIVDSGTRQKSYID